MVLLAGGPGQAATQLFDLRKGDLWQSLFPGYWLVAFDPRGTGRSDPVSCAVASTASTCAHELGSDRAYFTTEANVRDLEAVRSALGFPRLSLFGTSYGTELALGYARAFPARVERLLLDSVSPPPSSIATLSQLLRAFPVTLSAYCARVCAGVTANYAHAVITLANALALRPVEVSMLLPSGGRAIEGLDAQQFIDLVTDADLNPWLAAVLPAAVHAAIEGSPQALIRLTAIEEPTRLPPQAVTLNTAVYTATVCNDGPFPWPPQATLAERLAILDRELARLGATAFGGLGPWAVELGSAYACLGWPPSSVPYARAEAGPYPDVPVLAVAGAFDLRGTTAEARAVVARFPAGRLLLVANAGHSAVTNPGSRCVFAAIRRWLAGGETPRTCSAVRPADPIAAYPPLASVRLTPRRELALALTTIHEAEAMWLLVPIYGSSPTIIAGLTQGKLVATATGMRLSAYGIGAGVAISGTLRETPTADPPFASFRGTLTFTRQTHRLGTLLLDGGQVYGRLGRSLVVSGRLAPATDVHAIRSAAPAS